MGRAGVRRKEALTCRGQEVQEPGCGVGIERAVAREWGRETGMTRETGPDHLGLVGHKIGLGFIFKASESH